MTGTPMKPLDVMTWSWACVLQTHAAGVTLATSYLKMMQDGLHVILASLMIIDLSRQRQLRGALRVRQLQLRSGQHVQACPQGSGEPENLLLGCWGALHRPATPSPSPGNRCHLIPPGQAPFTEVRRDEEGVYGL